MSEKRYDLEQRTFIFAKNVVLHCKSLQVNVSNIEFRKQLVRSAGSIGANYIEANEAVSKKDFLFRIKICRKEAKETAFWLRLLDETNESHIASQGSKLIGEVNELRNIFSAILKNSV